MGVWEPLVPKELVRQYQGETWRMQRSATGSCHMVTSATKRTRILGWAVVWHEPWWHVTTYELASVRAREPWARRSIIVAYETRFGKSRSKLAYEDQMHAKRCKSLFVMLRQIEGWPWHGSVLVPHSHIQPQNYQTVTLAHEKGEPLFVVCFASTQHLMMWQNHYNPSTSI